MAESWKFDILGCWICEIAVWNPYEHIESAEHWKVREELQNLTESDDYAYSIIVLKSRPDTIEDELLKEKEE